MKRVLSPSQAVALIQSGDVLAVNGFGAIAHPEDLDMALAERFLTTGEPRDLTLVFAAGQGINKENEMIDRLGHEGLLKRVTGGHWAKARRLGRLAAENKIEAYNLPQGVISHLFRAAAGKKPGILTKIGLHTFMDPRQRGGALNAMSKDQVVKLMEIDGEEYLFYKAPQPNVAFIRGTTADAKGNITMEKEAAFLEALSIAQAVKANQGKVIVQVERLSERLAHPKDVVIPGLIVDAIVVCPEQKQTSIERYNPSYSGELRVPDTVAKQMLGDVKSLNAGSGTTRDLAHWIVARRAAEEVRAGAVVNLGIGIPDLVAAVVEEKGLTSQIVFTVESGTLGGIPSNGRSFGAAINPDVIYAQPYQFDFYDGGGLDSTFVGAAEIDRFGHVNVSRLGERIFGVGGFINITQSAKKVVFCFTFTSGGLAVKYGSGELQIIKEGNHAKFSDRVQEISFNGEYAARLGQEVVYVTERCVFRLTPSGLELSEIAPGIDLERDILAKIPFKPLISQNLKLMPAWCFRF